MADVAHGKGRGWQGKLRNISKKRTDSQGFLWISTVLILYLFLNGFSHIHHILLPRFDLGVLGDVPHLR